MEVWKWKRPCHIWKNYQKSTTIRKLGFELPQTRTHLSHTPAVLVSYYPDAELYICKTRTDLSVVSFAISFLKSVIFFLTSDLGFSTCGAELIFVFTSSTNVKNCCSEDFTWPSCWLLQNGIQIYFHPFYLCVLWFSRTQKYGFTIIL